MTIEQLLAEIIRAFCADALSSTVNLNVDLDVMLAALAPGPPRRTARPAPRIRKRLSRHPPAALPGNPRLDHHHRRHQRLSVFNAAPSHPSSATPASPANTPIPWWGGRILRYEFAERRAQSAAWKSAIA